MTKDLSVTSILALYLPDTMLNLTVSHQTRRNPEQLIYCMKTV